MNEIKFCQEKWGISDFHFYDDNLMINPDWLSEFIDLIGSMNLKINWIPIIASNIGGIPEAAGVKQYLIDDYSSLETWKYMLEEILRPNVYNEKCMNALDNSLSASVRYSERSFSAYIEQILG